MTISTNDIQALYIAYFNRPADTLGLKFWTDAANNAGSVSAIAGAFSASAEYTDTYAGMGTAERINTIYQNLFGRDAEAAGIAFWGNALDTGILNFGNIAYQIFQGAQNADKIAVDSKVSAAAAFTTSLDTGPEIVGYSGKAANAVVATWLKGITNPTNLAAATAPAALAAVSTAAIAAHDGATNIGQNYNLTIGADNLTGTAGADIFNALPINTTTGADADTLGNFDVIDGGAGNDTLNIYAAGVAGKNLVQQGTTTNIETINIFNDSAVTAEQFGTTTGVVASKFVGATAIWQAGFANKISGLASTTTAGFKQITEASLDVTAAAAATGATVALDQVAGLTADNVTTLAIAGKALKDITVSGSLIANAAAAAGTPAAKLALNATIGKDVQSVTVATSVKTTVTLTEDGASTKHLTTVDAAKSTGGVTYDATAATTVTTINTGAGKDVVTIASALTSTAKTASVSTGDGDDTVNVNVTAAAAVGNTATINTGAGKDTVKVAVDANVAYNIATGAGDDTVAILSGVVKTTDSIDGGEGVDTVAIAGKASYIAADYLTFTKVLKNFEAIHFTGATAVGAFDASQVAAYKTFTFDADGTISKVAADQALIANANLTATAVGYVAGALPVAPAAGSATTYGTGALTVTALTDATTVTVKGLSAALTIQAGDDATAPGGDIAVTLAGDVKTATVALANGVNDDDSFSVATLNLTNGTTGVTSGTGAYTALGGLTTLTLTGNGTANITNSTALTSVDATALNSVDAEGKATTGLVYTSTNSSVETIKLGGGVDHVTLSASTYGAVGANKIDTVTGLNFVVDTGALTATSDVLSVTGVTTAIKTFTTTQTDLDLVLTDAAAYAGTHGNADLVFQAGGNTYVFADRGTLGSVDSADIVVKLTGLVNLDSLILSLAV